MTTIIPPTFIGRLDALVRRGDRGRLAALRKLLAAPETWGPEVYAASIPLLPVGLPRSHEHVYLSVAGLHALWHRGQVLPAQHTGVNLGEAMATLARSSSSGSQGVERRVTVLLSSSGERLEHNLRQMIAQLGAAAIPVDFAMLLHDLLDWDQRDRRVQRAWARRFWREEETRSLTDREPA